MNDIHKMTTAEIIYFQEKSDHTNHVLEIARKRYEQGGIDKIVLASTFGITALKAAEIFKSLKINLLIIGEILEEGKSPKVDVCQALESQGHHVIWGTGFGDISHFTQNASNGLVAEAYYRLGQGFKVACEIILIAASCGYLVKGQKVISIAGTHHGADTAIVASTGSFSTFKDFKVHEILCKPY